MTDWRPVIRRLAKDHVVAQGTAVVARQIRDRAAAIDPKGSFEVEMTSLTVNGLTRDVALVVNNDEDAGRVEFGLNTGRRGSDGRSGLRPLGRAVRSVK